MISRQTFTNHGPNRFGVHHLAVGVDATRLGRETSVLANVPYARQPGLAVVVVSASHVRCQAAHLAIANCAWRADALRDMVEGLASGGSVARVDLDAHVFALVVDAGGGRRAFRVGATSDQDA